jgi:hypothetical protein
MVMRARMREWDVQWNVLLDNTTPSVRSLAMEAVPLSKSLE